LALCCCKDRELIVPRLNGFEVNDSTNLDFPLVITGESTITGVSAKISGEVAYEGRSSVLVRGFCYSEAQHPTVGSKTVSEGIGSGKFIGSIKNLKASTTYYLRAFAINNFGTSYGEEKSFTTGEFSIGLNYGGGIIFYLDASNMHGLIVAPEDAENALPWSNGQNIITQATLTTIGTGSLNTRAIIEAQGSGSYAASFCDNYTSDGFDDWFLPSIQELNKLFEKNDVVNNFKNAAYWSSTEDSDLGAYLFVFWTGIRTVGIDKKSVLYNVRPIRSF